ncbi:hypothetical protein U1701_17390 [Sphingomonas sp. PB2P19]|uniref:hypothetical protein n=1 Tax=Sphingomonas rhamnosi TaxID=3096156 RepID=UPI002FCB1FE2
MAPKTYSIEDRLKIEAGRLFSKLAMAQRHVETRVGELDALIHDAQAREHRRAAFNLRDRAAYRLGGAFEPVDQLDLDHVALTGWLALGNIGVLLLVQSTAHAPDGSVADHLALLFQSPAGGTIREYGIWVRWKWLRKLYREETELFLKSKKGRDPKASWRKEKATVNQTYLVAQICQDLQLQYRTFPNRGAAFDWIKAYDGNPRFADDQPPPSLAGLVAALR